MLYCECESPRINPEHDAGCRRCGRPVYFGPGHRHLAGELASCDSCPAGFDLEVTSFEVVEPGLRGYACPACGGRVLLYSAAWLSESPAVTA